MRVGGWPVHNLGGLCIWLVGAVLLDAAKDAGFPVGL